MLHKLFRGLAPIAAFAIGAAVSGCDGVNINVGEGNGVPLAELDMSGDAPNSVVLAGPDTVIVRDGDRLDIKVDGPPETVDLMRFSLDDGTLAISREKGSSAGKATVCVTMPSPRAVTIAGSGAIEAQSLATDSDINVLGSGSLSIEKIAAEELSINVAGSGKLKAAGTVDRLDINLLGSGKAEMEALKADIAKLTIAGSGSATFASDGQVNADVMGSGSVTVVGRATCKVNSMGSGTVTCRPAAETAKDARATKKPSTTAKRVARKSTRKGKRGDG